MGKKQKGQDIPNGSKPKDACRKYRRLGVDVFTTGQIAKLFAVAPRTVSKWIDAGRMKAYKIPGSNDRRALRADVMRFAMENKLTHVAEDLRVSGVLMAGVPEPVVNQCRLTLGCLPVQTAIDTFEAGMVAGNCNVVVLDCSLGRSDVMRAVARLRRGFAPPMVIVIVSEDETFPEAFSTAGALVMTKPVDPAKLASAVVDLYRRDTGELAAKEAAEAS